VHGRRVGLAAHRVLPAQLCAGREPRGLDVAEAVVELFAPVRTRYAELAPDPAYLDDVLAQGRAKPKVVAEATMAAVRERVGLLPAR
jgi:hypothetical protein